MVVDGATVMSREAALRALGLDASSEASADERAIRSAYRRLCLVWHPDKRPEEVEVAKKRFMEITCAYHALTTANFDQERWAATYSIPPLQRLEDVLALALSGADPFEIEAMLRARGEYRPHVNFGVDVHVPWEAGERPEATFDGGPAAYTKTRALGDGSTANELREMELAWAAGKVAGASEDRPWERVGGVGFDDRNSVKKTLGWKRSSLPERADTNASAEELNDAGMAHYSKKKYADALACYRAAARKEPEKIAYRGNVAAAGLAYAGELTDGSPEKIEALEIVIDACDAAISLDDTYVRAYVRIGKALLALGDAREDVSQLRRAQTMLNKALELDASSSAAKATLKDVEISLQLYDSDSD